MQTKQRNPTIDILRGLLLLLMTMTHLPTAWSAVLDEPFGFISAAEGFVFMSAFMLGKVFLSYSQRSGVRAANRWILSRSLRIYLAHLALLALAFTLIAWVAIHYERPGLRNLLEFYLQSPLRAILFSTVLIYQPPLLDILPMYVFFCISTPIVLYVVSRWSWSGVLVVSILVWIAAQFGLRNFIRTLLQTLGWDLPWSVGSAFDLYGWQLLWVLGLWLGTYGICNVRQVLATNRWLLTTTLTVCCTFFIWRHYSGHMGFVSLETHMFWVDKWSLSPVRIVNFIALVCVLLGYEKKISPPFRSPSIEAIGSASLLVFSVHIASVLLLLCVVDIESPPDGWKGLLVVIAGYATLFATAYINRVVHRFSALQTQRKN